MRSAICIIRYFKFIERRIIFQILPSYEIYSDNHASTKLVAMC